MLSALDTCDWTAPGGAAGSKDAGATVARVRRAAGDDLLAAIADGAPLEEAIDSLLDGAAWQDSTRACRRVGTAHSWRRMQADQRFPVGAFLDPELARGLREGVRLSNALALGVRSIPAEESDRVLRGATSDEDRENGTLWFLEDPGLPTPVVDALLALRRSEFELAAIDSLTQPVIRNVSVLRSLAAAWIKDLRAYLRFVASTPGANVPVSVVPLEERFDIELGHATHQTRLEAVAAL